MRAISTRARLLGASALVAAGFVMQPAIAQQVSNTGTGNAVVIPYYSVNNDWRTLVNVTNTTPNTIAVKFRMHEGRNSRDVMDFNVVLSPRDVWTATISQDGNGRPRLVTTDRSCTIPLSVRNNGLSANELAYSDFASGGVTGTFRDHDATNGDIARLRQGYIVMLVMGETSGEGTPQVTAQGETAPTSSTSATRNGSTAYFAKHVNGEPRNCNIVDGDFVARASGNSGDPGPLPIAEVDGTNPIPGQMGSGSPIARAGSLGAADTLSGAQITQLNGLGFGPIESEGALKVNATLFKEDGGIAGGIESLHVAEWGVGQNLVTAQNFPYFLEPMLSSTQGLWSTGGLAAVEAGIAATEVFNEWTNNVATGALGEWVVTLPTKHFHVDEDVFNIQAACNAYRNSLTSGGTPNITGGTSAYSGFDITTFAAPELFDAANRCPLSPFNQRFQAGNNGVSPVAVSFAIYDREERVASLVQEPGTDPSPAPPPPTPEGSALNFEANVLRIGRNANSLPSVLDHAGTVPIDVGQAGLGGSDPFGWMRLIYTGSDASQAGIPTTGFIFKKRDFGDATLNFGQATEHGYARPAN